MSKIPRNLCWYKDVCTMECKDNCIRFMEMSYLTDQSNIPVRRLLPDKLWAEPCDYEAFTRLAEIKSNILEFVDNGSNLYIHSNTTGNGKTSWAIKILLKYFNDVWPGNGYKCRGVFVHVPTFLSQLKEFGNAEPEFVELRHRLPKVDLVVWDDIGSTDLSSYDYSQLISYIDQRSLGKLANIYTGNLNGDALEHHLGPKLFSRVWQSSEIVELRGSDKR